MKFHIFRITVLAAVTMPMLCTLSSWATPNRKKPPSDEPTKRRIINEAARKKQIREVAQLGGFTGSLRRKVQIKRKNWFIVFSAGLSQINKKGPKSGTFIIEVVDEKGHVIDRPSNARFDAHHSQAGNLVLENGPGTFYIVLKSNNSFYNVSINEF